MNLTDARLNYLTPNERFHDAQRTTALPRNCPTCNAEPGDGCRTEAGVPMFRFHPERIATNIVAPRQRFGRCACGRPINTEGSPFCEECD